MNHRVMAALIPQARLHVAAGGGHLVLIDSADQIGPVITGFLREDHGASSRLTNRPN
jgi:pimeloyl-ACP methyl ester carboxylesterase